MTRTMRVRVFLGAGAVTALLLLWGIVGMPPVGDPGESIGIVTNAVAVERTGATNVVAAVLFDVRALDALVEEFLLFTAAAGATLLLRAGREEGETAPTDSAPGREVGGVSPVLRVTGVVVAGGAVLFGAAVVLHGHLTPGGGFQGGVVLATALLVLYVADDVDTYERVTSIATVERAEALGAALLIVVGLAGMLAGAAFLANVLPLGTPGRTLSSGTVAVLNIAAGIEVTAAFILLVTEFLEQTLRIRQRA